MTSKKETTVTTTDVLDEIPPASGTYAPPPDELLPVELRPLAQRVRDTATRWRDAETHRRSIERRNPRREYMDAQAAAAANGQDPAAVPDPRGQHAHDLDQARMVENAHHDAARGAWTTLVRGIVAHRDECRALVEPLAEQAQAEAVAALDAFLAARLRLDQSLGLTEWIDGLKPTGGVGGVNTGQGPRTLGQNRDVMWRDKTGKRWQLPVPVLRNGITIWAAGLDALRLGRARAEWKAARIAGDPKASRQPAPPDRLAV
jgi:hypothetical protein